MVLTCEIFDDCTSVGVRIVQSMMKVLSICETSLNLSETTIIFAYFIFQDVSCLCYLLWPSLSKFIHSLVKIMHQLHSHKLNPEN